MMRTVVVKKEHMKLCERGFYVKALRAFTLLHSSPTLVFLVEYALFLLRMGSTVEHACSAAL